MKALFEKYRPAAWKAVIGQPRALQQIVALGERGLGGRAYWITGKTGRGKTSIARLLAAELAERDYILEVDAAEVTGDFLRDAKRMMTLYGLGAKSGRAWIVNEAHGLRGEIIRRLLTIFEPIPQHVLWIFTTTNRGHTKLFADQDDAGPLLSRCVSIPLQDEVEQDFAQHLAGIAKAEGLAGKMPAPALLSKCLEITRRCEGNLRAMIQAIDAGELTLPPLALPALESPRVVNVDRGAAARKAWETRRRKVA
jgi:replication-associated recombination protein RarA